MVSIVDARTGQASDLTSRRAALRVCVHLPCRDEDTDWSDARLLLITDVLARAIEAGGGQVMFAVTRQAPDHLSRVGPLVQTLGLRPPLIEGDPDAVQAQLGGAPHVHVAPAGQEPSGSASLMLATAPAHRTDPEQHPAQIDPLAIRLALLDGSYHQPTLLDPDTLVRADTELRHWRRRVRAWAHMPSRPMPEDVRREIQHSVRDDLDTAALLTALRRAETSDAISDGAKFEVFVYADRFLGVELARDLGSPD